MTNERDQLLKAQNLIKAKKYSEARILLNTIPTNPTARKWLAKLEEIAPEFGDPFENVKPKNTKEQKEEKKKSGCVNNVIVICFVVLALAYFASRQNNTLPQNTSTRNQSNSQVQPREGTTLDNPFSSGSNGAILDGNFKTLALYRNVDNVVHSMNMFNSDPDPGTEWVLARVQFQCTLPRTDTCRVSAIDMRLSGKLGEIYDDEMFAVIDNAFEGEIVGGNQTSGLVGFIVEEQDSDFVLIVDEIGRGRKYFAIEEERWTGSR